MFIQDTEITFDPPIALAQLRRLFPKAVDDREHKADQESDILFKLHGLNFSLLTTEDDQKVTGLFNCDGGNQFSEIEAESHEAAIETVMQEMKKHALSVTRVYV